MSAIADFQRNERTAPNTSVFFCAFHLGMDGKAPVEARGSVSLPGVTAAIVGTAASRGRARTRSHPTPGLPALPHSIS